MGHWKVNYIINLIRWIKTFRWILNGCFLTRSVRIFQSIILIFRKDNFVNNHWGCLTIYHPLSYPLRSLTKNFAIKNKTIENKIYIFWQAYWMKDKIPFTAKSLHQIYQKNRDCQILHKIKQDSHIQGRYITILGIFLANLLTPYLMFKSPKRINTRYNIIRFYVEFKILKIKGCLDIKNGILNLEVHRY